MTSCDGDQPRLKTEGWKEGQKKPGYRFTVSQLMFSPIFYKGI